ncbi:MAG TPA: Gfo/Idh/MocA family oxidoreductase, partial [Bradyrhizobium sp.]
RRGIFAIADKPMAVTLAQLALIEETLAGRDLLTLLLEKRFYPVTLALRSIIQSGELGDVVSLSSTGPHKLVPSRRPAWMFEPSTYGGILADLTVHDIDLALWLTGYTGGTVSGWISSIPAAGTTDFPALGRAVLACDGGPQFAIEVDWIQPEASPRHGDYAMRISGTKGRANVLFAENRLLVETARPLREVDLPAGASPASFVFDHLARGETLQIPANEALRATRIAILAQESAANGGKPMRWS